MTLKKLLKGKERRAVRAKYYDIEPSVWIGKKGLTEEVIKEIERQLKQKKIIKIRFQKSLFDESERKRDKIKEILAKLQEKLNYKVEIVDIRGRTAILVYLDEKGRSLVKKALIELKSK